MVSLLKGFNCKRNEMAFALKEIISRDRSLQEYIDMFAPSQADLSKPILGCGDGSASLNAELIKRGGTAVSIAPL
jgi:hypothetical protein